MVVYERSLIAAQKKRGPLVTYNFCVPAGLMKKIDRLIMEGLFTNRAEFLRYALMRMIEEFKEI